MPGQSVRESRVSLSVAAGVAELTLARPERGNAIDPAMVQGLATSC